MWYKQENGILTIHVYVQPGAKQTGVAGFYGDALKIRLASPPVDGRANEALLQFLAHLFDVPLRQVELIRGDKSRYKKIAIKDATLAPFLTRLSLQGTILKTSLLHRPSDS